MTLKEKRPTEELLTLSLSLGREAGLAGPVFVLADGERGDCDSDPFPLSLALGIANVVGLLLKGGELGLLAKLCWKRDSTGFHSDLKRALLKGKEYC